MVNEGISHKEGPYGNSDSQKTLHILICITPGSLKLCSDFMPALYSFFSHPFL